MKLATLRNGRPDGHLVIVSRDLTRFVSAGRIVTTMQGALDDWERIAPVLAKVYDQLNRSEIGGMPFNSADCLAPLPRAYQWIDASGYTVHLERVRNLKGGGDEARQDLHPLMYQGGSDRLAGPTEPFIIPDADLAADYEAELAAVLGPVPMQPTRDEAGAAIRLIALCNDTSLRRLVSEDLEGGYGFFHSKPATSFAPVFVTPDELGPAWRDSRAHVTVKIHVNGSLYGQPKSGVDMRFDFVDLITAAARTRELGAGTILGSGTIANAHEDVLPIKRDAPGFGCIIEARTMEKIRLGQARTPFLKPDDQLRIEAFDDMGKSVFGRIDQTVTLLAR